MVQQQSDLLARRYLETLQAGEIEACLDLFRDDVVVKFPASVVTKTLSKADLGNMLRNMPNVFQTRPVYTLVAQITQGDCSCLEFTGMGRMKNGREFRNEYCIVFVAKDGLIAEMREYLDTGALLAAAKPPDA